MRATIGVDVGGSSIEAVAYDETGRIAARYQTAAVLQGGRQIASSAVTAVRALKVEDCAAVGVGVPGQVDPTTGQLTMAVNLGVGSEPYDLAEEIELAVGAPVTIENDVRAAALGAFESLLLEEQGLESLTLVSLGTGISAGVVLHGALLRGDHGMAGEIGHVVVDESGPLCRCGQRGCLEAMAAGPAIARAWPKGTDGTAATALFSAAVQGDPSARKVASRITGHVTTALTWLAAAYDTEVIVLAGGVPQSGDDFLYMVRDQVQQRGATSELAARRLRPDQVTLASVDDPPGPRGAAALAAKQLLPQAGGSRTYESKEGNMSKLKGGSV